MGDGVTVGGGAGVAGCGGFQVLRNGGRGRSIWLHQVSQGLFP